MNSTLKIIGISLLFLVKIQLFAQSEKGISNNQINGFFSTFSDFKANKITIPTDMLHKGDKISINSFFISDYITVVENGKKIKFHKDSIFAIVDDAKNVYRFINGNSSKLVDTSFLYIYEFKTTKTVNGSQTSKRMTTKEVPVTLYYFSYNKHNQIFPLTMDNIRKIVLKDFPQCHTQICNKFTNDSQLKELSKNTKMFVINEAFREYLKIK